MKKLLFFILVLMSSSISSQENTNAVRYDTSLAKELGADDYGMRKYVMAFLKTGDQKPSSSEEATRLQNEHLENIKRMAEQGVLALAGPFYDTDEYRGMYIFAVESVEEARALCATDPLIASGILKMEFVPWYGSAAVMKVNDLHQQIRKISITD